MCGRMTQQTPPEEVARIFDAEVREGGLRADDIAHTGHPARTGDPGAFRPSWNVAPTDALTVVLQREDGRFVERPRWGLIPSWAKSAREGARAINARAETVATSPAFRVAFAKRRCIVPSDGFYEWRRLAGTRKQPYFLGPVRDGGDTGGVSVGSAGSAGSGGAVLAMAGLWSVWKDPTTGLWVTSAAVITTDANHDVSPVHDRMPVLLPRTSWAAWLDPDERDQDLLRSMLTPAPDGILDIYPVSTRVNNVRNDGPDLAERLDPAADAAADPARPATSAPPTLTRRGDPDQGTLFD